MLTRRLFIASAFLLAIGAVAAPSRAAQTPNAASDFIASLGDEALTALTGKDLSETERETRFRSLLTRNFDVPAIGKFVLGRYWKSATPEEQQEYLGLFEDLLVKAYAKRFSEYTGQKLEIVGVRQDEGRDDYATVRTNIIQPSGDAVPVDWRVHGTTGSHKIIDVMVEGVSMAVTQRSEFASAIQQNGGTVGGLINVLRTKTQ